jgi:hypothetical protein
MRWFALFGLILFLCVATTPSICGDESAIDMYKMNDNKISIEKSPLNENSSNPPIITWLLANLLYYRLARSAWMSNISIDVEYVNGIPEYDLHYPLLFIRSMWVWWFTQQLIIVCSQIYYELGLDFPYVNYP